MKLVRDNQNWRVLAPSYCSHDFYIGKGQSNAVDGFARWGYYASDEALNFVASEFSTDKIVTTGTSMGASGAFYHGYKRDDVVGIMMDSASMDLSAILEAYKGGLQPLNTEWAVQCDGVLCGIKLVERTGFKFGIDEPHLLIQKDQVQKPIYFIWNRHDFLYNFNAEISMRNLHETINKYNPGGKSVAKEVCVSNPVTPRRKCTIHSPTKYDIPETEEVYKWVLSLVE